ncbi:hypothetical protein WN51_11031 [Melipona quadrifasciata]|uniref:Uncharacterized protein n=1 Tax=Melipona quadrifasciata TaxID=166423 RepID=A0A0N0U610_9HYME|nr:hypothetical protein WN51_11031 [Melipona quadrifasciata]
MNIERLVIIDHSTLRLPKLGRENSFETERLLGFDLRFNHDACPRLNHAPGTSTSALRLVFNYSSDTGGFRWLEHLSVRLVYPRLSSRKSSPWCFTGGLIAESGGRSRVGRPATSSSSSSSGGILVVGA